MIGIVFHPNTESKERIEERNIITETMIERGRAREFDVSKSLILNQRGRITTM
jgi:hypothetical protein